MPFRFRKTFKIGKGVKINLSKSGLSTSIGKKGSSVNIGKSGIRRTVGIPGTGLSHTVNLTAKGKNKQNDGSVNYINSQPQTRSRFSIKSIGTIIGILVGCCIATVVFGMILQLFGY